MNSVKHQSARFLLRVLAISLIVSLILLMAGIAVISVLFLHPVEAFTAVEGRLSLGEYSLAQKPVELKGDWEYYPGVPETGETLAAPLPDAADYRLFPIGTLTQAEETASYRLQLQLKDWQHATLYIPNLKDDVQVYLDGRRVDSLGEVSGGNTSPYLRAVFPLSQIEAGEQSHALVLSVNQEPGGTPLYKRGVILGTQDGISLLMYINAVNAMMIVGFLGIILISGCIFLAMRPEHKMISLLTLFDTMLILRIVFGMPEISIFLQTLWPRFYISDRTCLSLQLFFLMLGGIMGALLANHLFDPEDRIPRYITLPLPAMFGILAIVMPLNLGLFERMGIPLILGVYFLTFGVVFLQYLVYWKREKGFYAAFQIVKTTYVGLLIFYDIWMMNQKTHFIAVVYLYLIFFMAHLFIRLHDNNQSYQSVERLNQNLEKTVQERTAELTRANTILAELSTRDPLTGTHNRLYMETVMERTLASPTAEADLIHLCMFDLDHFKRVNDLHGHDVGDEQLKYVVNLVSSMMGEHAVLARVGGEEFVIFYTGLGSEETLQNVEALRRAVEQDAKRDPKHTTASFGLARYREGMSQKDLLKLADRCLYKAKNKGRNRVVYAFTAEEEARV